MSTTDKNTTRFLYDYSVEGVHGLKDKEGNIVLPATCDSTISFNYDGWGLYVVTFKRKKGVIDKTGKQIIPCEWKEISQTYRKDPDPVQIKADGKDTTAFFDRQGNRVEV